MTTAWTTVFRGPNAEALIVHSKLEAHAVPTAMPDGPQFHVGYLADDPYSTHVVVPVDQLERAREILGLDRRARTEKESAPDDLDRRRLTRLANSARWLAATSLLIPIAPAVWSLVESLRYQRLAETLGTEVPAGRSLRLAQAVCVTTLIVHGVWLALLATKA